MNADCARPGLNSVHRINSLRHFRLYAKRFSKLFSAWTGHHMFPVSDSDWYCSNEVSCYLNCKTTLPYVAHNDFNLTTSIELYNDPLTSVNTSVLNRTEIADNITWVVSHRGKQRVTYIQNTCKWMVEQV